MWGRSGYHGCSFLISCLSYLLGQPDLDVLLFHFLPQELCFCFICCFCCDGYGYPPQLYFLQTGLGFTYPLLAAQFVGFTGILLLKYCYCMWLFPHFCICV